MLSAATWSKRAGWIRARFVTANHDNQVAQDIVALVEHDPNLALSVLAVLEEGGLADEEFAHTQRSRLSLARGDRGALIEHGASGAELTTQQATDLLAEALSGAQVPEAAIVNAATLPIPITQSAKGQLVSAIRATLDRGVTVSAYETICNVSGQHSADGRIPIVDLGVEIVARIAATSGERGARKALTLRTIRAVIPIDPSSAGRILDEALKCGVVRSYDVIHDKAVSAVVVVDEAAAKIVVNRAETAADLEAAALLVPKITDGGLCGRYLRALFKRYGDSHKPTCRAAESIATGIESLVALHAAAPSTGAASHDHALLQRWAELNPTLTELRSASDQLGALRAPHKPSKRAEVDEARRMKNAIEYIKRHIVPNDLRIVAVGGAKSTAADDAFNEFGKNPPQWGEWLVKERNDPLTGDQIPATIASPKCIGVLVITKPASHAMTNQAKEAAERHSKPIVWIPYATKKNIREGMKRLIEKIKAATQDAEKILQYD